MCVQGLNFGVHVGLLEIFLCVQLPCSADWNKCDADMEKMNSIKHKLERIFLNFDVFQPLILISKFISNLLHPCLVHLIFHAFSLPSFE